MDYIKSVVIECSGDVGTIAWAEVSIETVMAGCCELCEYPETEVSFKCPVCKGQHYLSSY